MTVILTELLFGVDSEREGGVAVQHGECNWYH